MSYYGDFATGSTVVLRFNTENAAGTPITLGGSPAISVYKNSTTQSTAGITLSVDYDGLTGLHSVAVDTSADGTFYAAGNIFDAVITTGTVDGISAVGDVVGSFSLQAESFLRPTTAGRTLDVSAGGEAGMDWNNIGSPTTTQNLSGTTVKTATDVEADTADIQSRLPAALTGGGNIKSDALAINGATASAVRLALSAGVIVPGTVATAGFTPTTTEFEASDITEATADHYKNRVVIFTSGALTDQAATITAYSLVSGRGHFTVSTMTEAPANTNTFIII